MWYVGIHFSSSLPRSVISSPCSVVFSLHFSPHSFLPAWISLLLIVYTLCAQNIQNIVAWSFWIRISFKVQIKIRIDQDYFRVKMIAWWWEVKAALININKIMDQVTMCWIINPICYNMPSWLLWMCNEVAKSNCFWVHLMQSAARVSLSVSNWRSCHLQAPTLFR